MQDTITKALDWRFATQAFDTTRPLEADTLHTILEAGRLAPSSSGIEPWHFYVVENKEVRQQISEAGFHQPKITEAPVLVVVAYRTDWQQLIDENITRAAAIHDRTEEELSGLRQLQEGSAKDRGDYVANWLRAQTYIALGMMIETAALLEVDGGPMEGFSPDDVAKVLGLPEDQKVTSMLALGYRKDGPKRKKVRQSFDEAITFVK